MKKTLFAILLLFFSLLSRQNYVYANSYTQNNMGQENLVNDTYNTFMRVIDHSTPLFKDSNAMEFLFYLPYSYYVKILSVNEEYAHVECYDGKLAPAIDGYTPLSALQECDQPKDLIYLTYTIQTLNTTQFYADSECSTVLRLIFEDRHLGYYGKANEINGEQVFFVCYLGQTGYVKEQSIMPFAIPDHPEPIEKPLPPIQEQPTKQNDTDYTTLKTAIILCLLMAGIIGAFAAIKKKTAKNQAVSTYDELDFE